MVCHTLLVLSRSCSVPAGNRLFAVQLQWPSDTRGRMFPEGCVDEWVTVTMNRTGRPPGTRPAEAPRIVILVVSPLWNGGGGGGVCGDGEAAGAGDAATVAAGAALVAAGAGVAGRENSDWCA